MTQAVKRAAPRAKVFLSCLGFAGFSLLAGRARAQSSAFDVPAECGSELEFDSELERLAGAEATRARPSLLRIEREQGPGDYRLTIEVLGQRRELVHADCRVLFRSAVVIAASAVKSASERTGSPAAPTVATERAPSPADSQPANSQPAVVQPEEPKATPEEPRATPEEPKATPREPKATPLDATASTLPLHMHVAAGAGMVLGVVPDVAPAFELRAGIRRGRWGATLGGTYFVAQSVTLEGRSADIGGVGARAAGAVLPLRWLSCSVGLEVDWLFGRGHAGITNPTTDTAWTLAPFAEVGVIPLQNEHFAFEVAASGRVALVRPVFEVTGFRELYRVPSFGMAALARGVFHFR